MLRSSTTSFYQIDGLGSVSSLSNGSGALAQSYTYDSFGNIVATTGSLTNLFRYTGPEFDAETCITIAPDNGIWRDSMKDWSQHETLERPVCPRFFLTRTLEKQRVRHPPSLASEPSLALSLFNVGPTVQKHLQKYPIKFIFAMLNILIAIGRKLSGLLDLALALQHFCQAVQCPRIAWVRCQRLLIILPDSLGISSGVTNQGCMVRENVNPGDPIFSCSLRERVVQQGQCLLIVSRLRKFVTLCDNAF
jgi:hypothetical protein